MRNSHATAGSTPSVSSPAHQAAKAPAPAVMKILAHDLRWQALEALAHSDRRVHELVELLGQPFNLVSYHLRKMRDAHIVVERRSSADARDVYYTINMIHLRDLYFGAASSLHPALVGGSTLQSMQGQDSDGVALSLVSPARPLRVLFLCTYNSARSQMAEAILRREGGGAIEAYSAGSMPTEIHPDAVRVMRSMDLDISRQYSKHIDLFADRKFDYVITVCDRVREICPLFPDDPGHIHWSIPDPAESHGSEEERYRVFEHTARELTTRIRFLLPVVRPESSNNAGVGGRE